MGNLSNANSPYGGGSGRWPRRILEEPSKGKGPYGKGTKSAIRVEKSRGLVWCGYQLLGVGKILRS